MRLRTILLSLAFLTQAAPDLSWAQGNNYVARRFYCRSAEKADAGDQTISANGPSCAASRQAIQRRFRT